MQKFRNIFTYVEKLGHDYDYEPKPAEVETFALPGTKEKLEVIAARVEQGEDLWRDDDIHHMTDEEDPRRGLAEVTFLRQTPNRGTY